MQSSNALVLQNAIEDNHVRAFGKNFKSLIAAGSWTICDFHYGQGHCECCGRPIRRILCLKNQSHSEESAFPEVISIGLVCGPKVFMESCVGFYTDPNREWERQRRVWKDYIDWVILCVKHKKMWDLVPEALRTIVDDFLQSGGKTGDHSGHWWAIRDSKRSYLTSQNKDGAIPDPRQVQWASQRLLYAAKRSALIPQCATLTYDAITGFNFIQEPF